MTRLLHITAVTVFCVAPLVSGFWPIVFGFWFLAVLGWLSYEADRREFADRLLFEVMVEYAEIGGRTNRD